MGQLLRRFRRAFVAALAMVAVAAGCGDDEERRRVLHTLDGRRRDDHDRPRLGTDEPRPASGGRRGRTCDQRQRLQTLLARTPDGELVASLAADEPTRVDDTTWEFRLRPGITFHDGTVFDADAVVATVERVRRLIAGDLTDNDDLFATLAGARRVDATTVQILTTGPDPALPARMYWLKIVAPSAAALDDLSDVPNGTGPYRVVDHDAGQQITLEAVDGHRDGVPVVERVVFDFVPDDEARVDGLAEGRYDLVTNLPPEAADDAPQLAHRLGQEHPVIVLDADDAITADREVRRALNLALDKQAIVDEVYGGFAVVDPGQLLGPSVLGFDASLEAYPYDPDLAAQLIEQRGATGATVTLVGESSGRWLNDRALVEFVAAAWRAVGLEVDLQLLDFGDYLDVLFGRDTRPDAIFVSSSNELLDPSRQLPTYYQAGGRGASNSDAELADLVERRHRARRGCPARAVPAGGRPRTRAGVSRVAGEHRGRVRVVGATAMDASPTRSCSCPRCRSCPEPSADHAEADPPREGDGGVLGHRGRDVGLEGGHADLVVVDAGAAQLLVAALTAHQRHHPCGTAVGGLVEQQLAGEHVSAAVAQSGEVLALRPAAHATWQRPVAVRVVEVVVGKGGIVVLDGSVQRRPRLASREPRLEHPHPAVHRGPRPLGECCAGHRRPIGVDDREHTARAQHARHLGMGGHRVHPVHRLYRDHHVGARVGQAGGVAGAGDVPHVRQRARLGLCPHVGVRLDAHHLRRPDRRPSRRQAGAAAEVDHLGPIDAGVCGEHPAEARRGCRPVGVVQVGEAREPVEVAPRRRHGGSAHLGGGDGSTFTTTRWSVGWCHG
ncbi:MAG: ABC transporter substrate-binding protein [Ilumatobacteraceae bacterium]